MNRRAQPTGPSHRGSPRRRGNFFVLVVGTLALLSVIAVAYVTVGRSDRQLSNAIDRSGDLVDARDAVRNHILDVLARDVTAALDEPGSNAPDRKADDLTDRLETWDAPFTRYDRSSVATPPPNPMAIYTIRFQPWGDGDDPWLAFTMPTDLGLNGVPAGADELDDFIRDWGQISNVAPDGRFVNLWNLRGDFDAAPGSFGMGRNLTLLQPGGGAASVESAYDDTPTVLNGNALLPFTGEPADPDRPSHWTMHQIGAFRPIVEARDNGSIGVNDFRYTPYQWADADGDGMADSRWFELVDSSNVNPNDINSLSEARYILPPQDGYRWFAAVRIIDLSSLVNVNIATDLVDVAGPSGLLAGDFDVLNAPIGATPADVDRLRLLSQDDVFRTYVSNSGSVPLSYADIPQAVIPGDTPLPANNYTMYDQDVARNLADRAVVSFGREVGVWGGGQAGDLATDAELATDPLPLPLAAGTGRVDGPERRAEYYEEFTRVGQDPVFASVAASNFDQPRELGVDDLIELLTYWGANNPDITSRLESVLGVPFDLADATNAPGAREGRPMSLLRSERSLDVERRVDVESASGALRPDGVADDAFQAQVVTDVRRLITTLSGARRLASARFPVDGAHPDNARLNLDLRSDSEAVAASLPDLLEAGDAQAIFERIYDTLVLLAEREEVWQGDPEFDEFRFANYGYRSAELGMRLAAHLTANLLDSFDDDDDQTVLTLAVSEQGLMDIDAAVNAGDTLTTMAGAGFGWSRWNDTRSRLNENGPKAPDMSASATPQSELINVYGFEPQPFITEVTSFFWYADAPRGAGDPETASSGSPDWNFDALATSDADLFDEFPVTINGAVDTGNDDYIVSVIGIQLYNPFNARLNLSSEEFGGAADRDVLGSNDDFHYYIEFANRFYKLVEYNWEDGTFRNIVLDPFETRNFYLIGEDPRLGPASRLDDVVNGTATDFPIEFDPAGANTPPVEQRVLRWITAQLSQRARGGEPIVDFDPSFNEARLPRCLPEFDPVTGAAQGAAAGW